jgi:hypothetical protein
MNQMAAASQRRPPEGGHYKFNSEFNCEERANAMNEAGEASLAPLVLSPDIEFRRKRWQATALQNEFDGDRVETFGYDLGAAARLAGPTAASEVFPGAAVGVAFGIKSFRARVFRDV